MTTLIATLIFAFCTRALCQTPADTRAAQPSFTINAYLLENVAMVASERVLEIAVTNISEKELLFGIYDDWPIWGLFTIDFRDPNGKPVPMTPTGRDMVTPPTEVTHMDLVRVERGRTLRVDLLLNRTFELSQPGRYTMEVHLLDRQSGVTVTSNPVSITIPPPKASKHKAKPPFSITLSTPFDSVEEGWQIPVRITVKNTSRTDLRWAVWDGWLPDEFDSGLQVRDKNGNSPPRTEKTRESQQNWEICVGRFSVVRIPPGKSLDEVRSIGRLIDVSKPGTYAIQEVLADPSGEHLVKSNLVSVDVVPSASATRPTMAPKPPFIVTISLDPRVIVEGKTSLRICQTNISNRDITLDNFTFDDEIHLVDAEGKSVDPPKRSAADKMGSRYYETFARERSKLNDHPEFKFIAFEPGNTVCGDMYLVQPLRPGETYSVQIVRHDYPDRPPDKKIEDMPLVESNTLMFEAQK